MLKPPQNDEICMDLMDALSTYDASLLAIWINIFLCKSFCTHAKKYF